jgi:hypothetical protein
MGLPAAGRWNELHCRLRDELDDAGLLRRCFGPPHRKGAIDDSRANFSACASRFCGDDDLLAHLILDVPPEDLFKNLRRRPTLRVANDRVEIFTL